jgi:predicted nuclease with TOPRIM domain
MSTTSGEIPLSPAEVSTPFTPGFFTPKNTNAMKTPEEYQQEIAELSDLIKKMKFQLSRSLESMIELIAEVNRLKSKYEP